MAGCAHTTGVEKPPKRKFIGEALIPATMDLLRLLSSSEPAVACLEDLGIVASTAYSFPDRIGRGELIALIFGYGGKVRLDIRLEHNRFFATQSGKATRSRCFLNDYLASTLLPPDSEELPPSFVCSVLSGVRDAGNAVSVHNRRHGVAWLRTAVAESSDW